MFHDQNPVGDLECLFRVGRRNQGGALRMAANGGDNVLPRTDIHALKRLIQQQQAAGFCFPAGNDRLLLIAAGQRPDGGGSGGRLDRQPLDRIITFLQFAVGKQEAGRVPSLQMRQADGCGNAFARPVCMDEGRAVPVLRRHGDTR